MKCMHVFCSSTGGDYDGDRDYPGPSVHPQGGERDVGRDEH